MSAPKQPLVVVDAFTNEAFKGNPAAVCVLAAPRDDAWMQKVAMEMNLAETAFLSREGNDFRLRWFTPAVEVDLCGHATLASAHTLWEGGYLPAAETCRFHTRSGLLTAERAGDFIAMLFPAEPVGPSALSRDLLECLGVDAVSTGVTQRLGYALVELATAEAVRAVSPDFRAMGCAPYKGAIVTACSDDPRYDVISRFFAPALGIDEDPVTGSAHCALGPYWSARLRKANFIAYQASARGGIVRVGIEGDRVRLSGQAVTVLSGELAV